MKLRDHPLVDYQGVRTWPPIWVNIRGHKLTGEIGVLVSTRYYRESTNHLYLGIEFENRRYMGCIACSQFCEQLNEILQAHIGRAIKEIGDLDLPELA